MMSIIVPILVLGLLGVAFAIFLSVSFKKLAVQVDPKVESIMAVLPMANCGACGFAGCLGFAEAVAALKADPAGCIAGGPSVAEKVGQVLGTEVEAKEEMLAFVACQVGRRGAKTKYEYEGVANCQAAAILFGGDRLCAWGCLGLDSCVTVCPFDAIHVNAEGLAVVDRQKCRACRKCVAACPRHLIYMVPKLQQVLVACTNHERGKKAKEVCPLACTACRICEKNCPESCIPVSDNLAVIDFKKCTQCGTCVEKCPQKSIVNLAKVQAVSEVAFSGPRR